LAVPPRQPAAAAEWAQCVGIELQHRSTASVSFGKFFGFPGVNTARHENGAVGAAIRLFFSYSSLACANRQNRMPRSKAASSDRNSSANIGFESKLWLAADKLRSKRNLVQSREFSEMLKKTLNAYRNRAIATQEVIEELIKLAKQMSAATQRGVDLGLNDDEVAFYDALAANDSALKAMGKDELKVIAVELVTQVRKSVTIDWTLRESARARIRVMVKRILAKHGYPPDLREEATKTVLAQAELLCADWAA
jgi:hypothetical protein